MELIDLNSESSKIKKKDLEESQDLLGESSANFPLDNSQEDSQEVPNIMPNKKRKKVKERFIKYYIDLFIEKYNSEKTNNKIIMIISLLIIIGTFIIKFILYFIMIISLVKRFKKLHIFIFERILDDIKYCYFLYLINNFFLIIGFIIYFLEMFCQFIIRYKTLLDINLCSLKPLILSKCLFFVSLGLIPEVIFANIPFKSKQNIFLSFFKMKFLIQPYIILILIIYLLFILFFRSEKTKKERIIKEVKLIKKVINDFVDKYIFVWNDFDEKNLNNEKKKEKDQKKKEEDSINNINNDNNINNENESTKLNTKNSDELKRRKTMGSLKRPQEFGTVIRRKRKDSKDENEDKSKFKKLLSGIDEEDEDEENKENGFLNKLKGFKNKVTSFWSNTFNIFTRIKKYIILGIIAFIIISPVINGIFGYGYYIFYESKATMCFQIDLTLCFVFGFSLILLTD